MSFAEPTDAGAHEVSARRHMRAVGIALVLVGLATLVLGLVAFGQFIFLGVPTVALGFGIRAAAP